uniref:Uncharacterized protein n=1 Tax=viral metagenome TaxID=1070528 RepID=A0A6M3XE05_9ZZZZ
MGSSGGGGGSSGQVAYPAYLSGIQSDWLSKGDEMGVGADEIEKSITAVMNSALGSSPWLGASAYDPSGPIASYEAAVDMFAAMLAGVDFPSLWESFFTTAKTVTGEPTDLVIADIAAIGDLVVTDAADITDAEIVLDVTAFANQLDDEILTKVLPRFRRGMQDINAVVSSSFAIGESNIEGFRDRDVSRHSSALRVTAALKNADIGMANMGKDVQVGIANLGKDSEIAIVNMKKDVQVGEINTKSMTDYVRLYFAGADILLKSTIQNIAFEESYARIMIEGNRIKIVALKEENDVNNTIGEEDALWDLGVFQAGANLLAGAGGGVAGSKTSNKPNVAMSVLGGAMSGAAAGGTVAGPYGAAVGAVLGAAMGLMSSM